MTVQLTPQQTESVQSLLQTGAYRDEAQVIDEALNLLTMHEELRACVNAGVRELENGKYRTYQPEERERFLQDIDAASNRREQIAIASHG